jgi:hypothetical protein
MFLRGSALRRFRENLTPVQLVPCDAAGPNQKWGIITSSKHNNVAGFVLIVRSLMGVTRISFYHQVVDFRIATLSQTNACLNFDPRRAAGNQVILFSCGGRADGSETHNSFRSAQWLVPVRSS